MTVFLTRATGFLGSYVSDLLLGETDTDIALLTRAKDRAEGIEKFYQAMQLHMDAERFRSLLPRVRFIPGDLTAPGLGISAEDRAYLVANADSVLHIAASLNRKSEKACLNHNLRGTLSVIQLAQEIHANKGLRRFSHVSTVAVAGQRDSELVQEDEAIDWDRSDYDPYGRTKKFCEHMVRSLIPSDVELTFFRPSTVMGDSRFAATTQFDMVRAFCVLADLPVIPFGGDVRIDIVNADWVGRAIATLHMKQKTDHQIYHLSNGVASESAQQIAHALVRETGRRPAHFGKQLEGPFGYVMNQLASSSARNTATLVGSLFKVFLPYITYDTVFDNTRATTELGVSPAPFTSYCAGLYRFAKGNGYKYPAVALPFSAAEAPAYQPKASAAPTKPVEAAKPASAPKAAPEPAAPVEAPKAPVEAPKAAARPETMAALTAKKPKAKAKRPDASGTTPAKPVEIKTRSRKA